MKFHLDYGFLSLQTFQSLQEKGKKDNICFSQVTWEKLHFKIHGTTIFARPGQKYLNNKKKKQ